MGEIVKKNSEKLREELILNSVLNQNHSVSSLI